MSRIVNIATASILLDRTAENGDYIVDECIGAINESARWRPNMLVLPEEIAHLQVSVEEDIDVEGSITWRLARAAVAANTNLVVGLRECVNGAQYNIAAFIDRNGGVIGKYAKTHLAPGEFHIGVVPGDEYPVFDLDFGKVGAMICMDIHYPEAWRILALQGADIIVHPTMWLDYTGNLMESLVNARAIDNQCYVVTSHYVEMPFLAGKSMGFSRIVDPYGRSRACTSHRPGVAFAEIDLDEVYEYWVTGELKKEYPTLKDCFFGDRRPETYGILTRPDEQNSWRLKNPKLYSP